MITEEILQPILTDIDPNTKTISVAIDSVLRRDGVIVARSRDRRAFTPGQIQDVRAYIGVDESPEIDYLNAIWTQEVIDAYNATQQPN